MTTAGQTAEPWWYFLCFVFITSCVYCGASFRLIIKNHNTHLLRSPKLSTKWSIVNNTQAGYVIRPRAIECKLCRNNDRNVPISSNLYRCLWIKLFEDSKFKAFISGAYCVLWQQGAIHTGAALINSSHTATEFVCWPLGWCCEAAVTELWGQIP